MLHACIPSSCSAGWEKVADFKMIDRLVDHSDRPFCIFYFLLEHLPLPSWYLSHNAALLLFIIIK